MTKRQLDICTIIDESCQAFTLPNLELVKNRKLSNCHLINVSGNNEKYVLCLGTNVIGRGEDCTYQIIDNSLSRHHFEVNVSPMGTAVIKDLQSVNKTRRNNLLLQCHIVYGLYDGNIITAGKQRFSFKIESDWEDPLPQPPSLVAIDKEEKSVTREEEEEEEDKKSVISSKSSENFFNEKLNNLQVLNNLALFQNAMNVDESYQNDVAISQRNEIKVNGEVSETQIRPLEEKEERTVRNDLEVADTCIIPDTCHIPVLVVVPDSIDVSSNINNNNINNDSDFHWQPPNASSPLYKIVKQDNDHHPQHKSSSGTPCNTESATLLPPKTSSSDTNIMVVSNSKLHESDPIVGENRNNDDLIVPESLEDMIISETVVTERMSTVTCAKSVGPKDKTVEYCAPIPASSSPACEVMGVPVIVENIMESELDLSICCGELEKSEKGEELVVFKEPPPIETISSVLPKQKGKECINDCMMGEDLSDVKCKKRKRAEKKNTDSNENCSTKIVKKPSARITSAKRIKTTRSNNDDDNNNNEIVENKELIVKEEPSSMAVSEESTFTSTRGSRVKRQNTRQKLGDTTTSRSGSASLSIIFTGLSSNEESKWTKFLKQQWPAIKIVTSPDKADILVTDQVKRTVKLLSCVMHGVAIVNVKWLHEAELLPKSGSYPDYHSFLLKEPSQILAEKGNNLFKGVCFFVTPSVKPPGEQLSAIVKIGGGRIVCDVGDFKKCVKQRKKQKLYIVSCDEDLGDETQLGALVQFSVPIVSVEAILSGVMTQSLVPEMFALYYKDEEIVPKRAAK